MKPRRNADLRIRQAKREGDDAIRQTVEFMRAGGRLEPDMVEAYPPGSWRGEGEGAARFTLSSTVRLTVFWEQVSFRADQPVEIEVHVQGEWWHEPCKGRRQRFDTPDLAVTVPGDNLAALSWAYHRPWLRPEVQSLIYELLTEVLPRWRGPQGEYIRPAKENPDTRLRELYRELLRDSTNRTRWLELIHAANRAGMGVRFYGGAALITGVAEDGTLEFNGQAVVGIFHMMFNISSPSLITGGLEFVPLTGPPIVQPNMDKRMRDLERAAALGIHDALAKLQSMRDRVEEPEPLFERLRALWINTVIELDAPGLPAGHWRVSTPGRWRSGTSGPDLQHDQGIFVIIDGRMIDGRYQTVAVEYGNGERHPIRSFAIIHETEPTQGPPWYRVKPNMDERMRDLERRASAGDAEAKLRFLYEQFRARPWLETWLAWKLEEANQQVWAKNREWSPDCDPCGEVTVDRVRYLLEHALATHTPHLRVDGLPTKPSYPKQRVRRRYEGARTVVLGRAAREDGWHGIAHEGKQSPDWLIVVAPYLGRHLTQHGLHIHDVFPDMPRALELEAGTTIPWLRTTIPWLLSRPDHYFATEEEVRRFIAPVSARYWTEGPGAAHEADVCDQCGTRTTHLDAGFCLSLQSMGCQCGGSWIPAFDAQANPARRRLTYGRLPSREEFDAAFEEEAPAGYRVRLSSRDYDALEWAGLYHYAPRDRWDEDETWEILNALVATWSRGDEDPYGADYAGDLASSILTTLGFEWV